MLREALFDNGRWLDREVAIAEPARLHPHIGDSRPGKTGGTIWEHCKVRLFEPLQFSADREVCDVFVLNSARESLSFHPPMTSAMWGLTRRFAAFLVDASVSNTSSNCSVTANPMMAACGE